MTTPWSDLFDLTGRTAVVTGAAHGIGEACARRLGELGATPILVDRDGDALTPVAGDLPGAVPLAVDVTDDDAGERIATAAADATGRIDVVVNAAGVFPHGSTLDVTAAEWAAVVGVNLDATFAVAQACARVMLAGDGGAIVNIASQGAFQPRPGMAAYAASKGGVVSLTRALALDLAPTIRVNAVAPGPITDTAGARARQAELADVAGEAPAAHAAALPLQRTGRADEVAALVAFLATDAAGFITGETVTIDGGRSLG